MAIKGYNREQLVINLVEILFVNGELSRTQNLYPSTYQGLGKEWDFFPFQITGLNSELDLDSGSSSMKLPNLSQLSPLYQNSVKRDNLASFLIDSVVTIYYIFLDGEIIDDVNTATRSYKIKEVGGSKIYTEATFSVATISENAGVVTLQLQNPLNAIKSQIPQKHYSGVAYRELPIDNSPLFTVGTDYF